MHHASRPMPRSSSTSHRWTVLRSTYLAVYGGCTALGAAAVARPATVWAREVGLFGSASPSVTPLGWAFAFLGLAIAACALGIALDVALERKPTQALHAALLVLVAVAAALRTVVEPLPA